jgi:hypothetical protein
MSRVRLSAWAALLFLIAAAAPLACGTKKCTTTAGCAMGERCDFDNMVCIAGCKADSDCLSHHTCNVMTAICNPIPHDPFTMPPGADGGVLDTGTSTTTNLDAGAGGG